ncbi:MAG: L-Ala-D/L-Glu epimerase, partial [Thermoleophilaceae bacterium]|nr:L-Ala-D/L-Glu epimerase [Thermoleophilaceae bacterium]
MRRSLARLSIPLCEPFATAGGVVAERELALLRLEDDDGAVGYGEAAPLVHYDGVTMKHVLAALRGQGAGEGGPPQARTAEEMARLDLEARREGRPIGEPGAEVIPVNKTLAGGPPAEVAERAAEGVREGFSCFKVKVGLPDDEERVAAVREAVGPWPAVRIDANGAWSPQQAVSAIERLAVYDLQLVEQPCRTLEEMAEVRREVDVLLAADESVATPADVRAAVEAEACDIVNVKLAPSGGFTAAREALREATSHGLGAYLSST